MNKFKNKKFTCLNIMIFIIIIIVVVFILIWPIVVNIFLLKYELYDYNNNLIKNVDYNKLIISFIEPMKTKPYTLNNIEEMTYGTKIIIYFKYNNTFSNEYYNKCIIILGKDGQVMFE